MLVPSDHSMPNRTGADEGVDRPGEPVFAPRVSGWSRFGEFLFGMMWAVFVLAAVFPPSGSHAFLWFTLPFGTLMATHFLRRAFDSSPRLVVSSSGILDKTSPFGGTLTIPWEDVLSVRPWGGGVEVEVRDPADLRRRAGLGRRCELLIRRIFARKSVLITPTLAGTSRRDLMRELEAALHRFERAQLGFTPEPLEGQSVGHRQLPASEGPDAA